MTKIIFQKRYVAILICLFSLATYVKAQPNSSVVYINVPDAKVNEYTFATKELMEDWKLPPDNLNDTPICYDYDDQDCLDENEQPAWNKWVYTRAIVEHPNFPGCPISIRYKTRVCKTNHLIRQQYIMDIALVNKKNTNCETLRNYLGWTGTPEDVYSFKDAQFVHDLYALVAKHNFKQFCENMNDYLFCGDYDHVRISYYNASCQGACRGHFNIPIFGFNFSFVLSSPRPCNVTACCRIENYFCVEPETFELVHKEKVTPVATSDCLHTQSDTQQNCLEYYLKFPFLSQFLTDTWASKCNKIDCNMQFLDLGGDNMEKK